MATAQKVPQGEGRPKMKRGRMTRIYKSYSLVDQSCFDLAVRWIHDDMAYLAACRPSEIEIERLAADLAQMIQRTIEEWLLDRANGRPLLFEETLRRKEGA